MKLNDQFGLERDSLEHLKGRLDVLGTLDAENRATLLLGLLAKEESVSQEEDRGRLHLTTTGAKEDQDLVATVKETTLGIFGENLEA